MTYFRLAAVALLLASLVPHETLADKRDLLQVGPQPDGSILVPTNQLLTPAGRQVAFAGRPVDLLVLDQGRLLAAKNMRSLVFIDPNTGQIIQTLELPSEKDAGRAFSAVGLAAWDDRILATDCLDGVRIANRGAGGKYQWDRQLLVKKPAVGGAAYPTGVALADAGRAWVCSSRGNELQLLNLENEEVEARVPVGVAPYGVVVVGNKAYVSNWGGDRPSKKDKSLSTSETPVHIDPRTSVANRGSVSIVSLVAGVWRQTKTIPVGSHASGIAASPDGRFVFVASANTDTVAVIDAARDEIVETIRCQPEARLPFGAGCNALAVSGDGRTLFVANGTGNCIAVVQLGQAAAGFQSAGKPAASRVVGMIPTGWYPGAVRLVADGRRLFVANVKGHGSLLPRQASPKKKDDGEGDDPAAPQERGKNSHDHLGTVSLIDVPGPSELKEFTEAVNANNRLGYALANLEKPRPAAKPAPVPERHGEPSVFEHVIYVIKENRTYDQVLGDMKEGNGDASLCMFGEDVTPNQHKLAREFVLLDNFYCSGVLSADGHSWTNSAYATDYLEKQFGQFVRSYPYEGSDPLAFATSGFLWDNALVHQKSFRNYGEFVRTAYDPKRPSWRDLYADYQEGTHSVAVNVTANLPSLDPHTHRHYPGFPLLMPDVYRAELFVEELKRSEQTGRFPHLIYLFLPNNHTNGTRPGSPTPRAMVADNDLALGRVVEAVSKSRFWPTTCIMVTEDDPQNGFDHVDGHRTVGFVISPYTKRHTVDSMCYNQTGLVKTIELILGLPPMTQLDLSATPLRSCFVEKADLTSYEAASNKIPLDEMNARVSQLDGRAKEFAVQSLALDLEVEDRADEETFNRILWFATRGDAPYPGDK